MSHPFTAGEQVWTRYDEDWWPAKVITPALAGYEDDGNLVVQYYSAGAEVCGFPYNPDLVVPFELSSEKAVTANPDIQKAIEKASADDSAIRVTHHHHAAAAAATTGAATTTTRLTTASSHKVSGHRRGRDKQQQQDRQPQNDASNNDGYVSSSVEDATLVYHGEELQSAMQANDIATLRRTLLKLARVKPTFRQLQATKIGVVVGDILLQPSLAAMQPIVACILRFWMQELPDLTREALTRFASMGGVGSIASASTASASSGTNNRQQAPATAATSAASTSTALPQASTDFGNKLISIVAKLDCEGHNTHDNMADFARRVETERVTNSVDARIQLMTEMMKESHHKLRGQLLTGEISLVKFFTLSKEELMSPEEQLAAQEHAESLAFRAGEGKKDKVGDALFECPECGRRNATHYEIQIRSCDEPATSFIECLECGHNWSEN